MREGKGIAADATIGADGVGPAASGRLRVVVFTRGPLAPINRVFFERLARDPLLDVAAIVVDEYQRPQTSFITRVARGVREDGLPWLAFKLRSTLGSLVRSLTLRLFERVHGRARPAESYATLELRTGVPVYRVPDIHNDESLDLIRSLRPQLGMIVGGRILRDAVITIPEYGTLNIHKRKVPEYRGGGPVGYWEILAGEPSIGITIHYATSQVDAGPVLAEATIPIEVCDTLESLRIKADLLGARIYHETVRRFAVGLRQGVPQDTSHGTTYRAPSELKVWRLQRRLERKAAAAMPLLRTRPSWPVRLRVLAQYVAMLPGLLGVKKRLVREHRAPICILFYHVVANRPLNHMCLPLEAFVRQVEFLHRYYAVVSLDEAVERLGSGKNDQVAAAITFDDGYRDNAWAIEYLRYFGIPAGFFVSIGHVRDGSAFEHDRRRGFEGAVPMSEDELRRLVAEGFIVGSHGVHHEDYGALDPATGDRLLRESRELIREVCGQPPAHFSFPKGQRGLNITEESFALATKHYPYVFSAYGGYCFPQVGRRHFLRVCHPTDERELAMLMDGYTGFRQCLAGNAWGLKTEALAPYSMEPDPGVAARSVDPFEVHP